jgi:hypothetical protein
MIQNLAINSAVAYMTGCTSSNRSSRTPHLNNCELLLQQQAIKKQRQEEAKAKASAEKTVTFQR